MTYCPKCQSIELRVIAHRAHVSFSKEYGWFGRVVPRVRVVAIDLACAECLYAFTLRPDGSARAAPIQEAYDTFLTLKQGLANAANGAVPHQKAGPVAKREPRPAGDPRVKR